MEAQTMLPGFKRAARVGFNILGFKSEGQVLYVKVLNMGVFEKNDGKKIDFADVVDLTTGEEARMWLDGALKYNLNQTLAKKRDYGFSLEIRYDGQKQIETKNEKGEEITAWANTYSMWELSEEETKSDN
jgi:hypothetical protein